MQRVATLLLKAFVKCVLFSNNSHCVIYNMCFYGSDCSGKITAWLQSWDPQIQFLPEPNHPPLPAALTSLFPHWTSLWCWSNLRFQLLKPLWDFKTIKPQTEVYDPESQTLSLLFYNILKAACEKGTYSKNNDLLAGILWLWGDKMNQCEKWRWHFEIQTSVFCDSVPEVCFETQI